MQFASSIGEMITFEYIPCAKNLFTDGRLVIGCLGIVVR